MKTLKSIALGTIAGTVLSLLGVALVAGAWLLLTGHVAVLQTVLLIGVLNGAVVGAVGVTVRGLTAGAERIAVAVLVSVAVAALCVMLGSYEGSMVPVAIYALAIVNGLLIARATAGLARNAYRTA